ncbi:cation acetate symporter [Streptomyces sp. NPDC091281]|uniref:sodium/solute symporter n=1 Tax=Streptomyces sp. NPDC091281 TaxID=3365985 RepID=UPI00381CCA4D
MTDFGGTAQTWSLVAFCAAVSFTLLLCVLTGPDSDDLAEFYTGYTYLSPLRNGLAVAGDYISAATVLTIGGVIALCGYDGIVLAVSTLLSLLVLMFLLAEPLRNTGRFTMGDALARRMPGRRVRIVACLVTVAALVPMTLVQLASTGQLVAYVLGFSHGALKTGCVIGVGALMIVYAAIGGMRGTALLHILKIVALLGSGMVVAALVLRAFDWSPGALFDAAAARSGAGAAYLGSGLQFAGGTYPRLDMVSTQCAIVLGGACLPHVTMRMYTAGSAREVRRAMSWAVSSVALFVLVVTVIAVGATALVGRTGVMASDPRGNTAYLVGSRAAFGAELSRPETLLFTAVTTAVFLTLLASVASMTLACANSLAHDVIASLRRGMDPVRETTVARVSAVVVGAPVVALAALVQHRSLQPLATVSFCLAASAIAPALVYSLFWRRFTRTGLLWTLVGGSLAVLLLMPGTRLVSGTPTAAFPEVDLHWFPFTTTAPVSIPLGFLLGWLGSVLPGRRARREARRVYAAVEPLILAGPESPPPRGRGAA